MKIFRDTLQKPNGKWDYRKLTAFVAFVLGDVSGLYVVFSDFLLKKEINSYAIGVVGLFFSLATGQAVISTWNKRIDKRLDIDQEPNPQYTNEDDDTSRGTY